MENHSVLDKQLISLLVIDLKICSSILGWVDTPEAGNDLRERAELARGG